MKKIIYLLLLSSLIFATTEIKEVKFENLTQISKNIAMETSKYKKDEPYSELQINNAIKEFYDFRYFKDIWITSEDGILIFHFKEKPFIASLEMNGYKTREDDLKLLFNTINIKKGNMYSPKKVEQSKQRLLNELEKEGYINSIVEIEVEEINESSVAIKFLVNKGEEMIIKKINYSGAKNLDKELFEDTTANKEEENFGWWFGQNDGVMSFDQLEYDGYRIKETYLENGYLDAKVEAPFALIDFNTNQAEIDIIIEEGKQYKVNNIVIYLDENIKNPDTIYPELKLKKEKTFNIKKLRQDVNTIKTKVSNEGYAFTEVRYDIRKDDKNSTVDVIFNVIPGEKVYINDVIISGNTRTLDRVIRRNIYLAPKDQFNLTDYLDSIAKLNRTGFFETVKINKQRISKDKMNLIVTITEAATGNLMFGGGYGSYDGWMLNASINDRNILGSGLDLGLSIDHSDKKDDLNLALKNPSINDSIYNSSFNIYRKDALLESSDEESETGDETTITEGVSISVGRSIGRNIRIGTLYSLEEVDVSYELTDTSNSMYTTSAITPYISFNNTDSYFIPRKGIMTGTSLKKAGLGGDADYIMSSTYFKYFYSLENLIELDWILRYKTTVKFMKDTGEIPQGSSFYLGGVNSVRGYESYAFQPEDDEPPYKKYWTNTLELSFPLLPSAKMRWALFYDHGMVGKDGFSELKKSGYGAVIAWYSPVGPLQFIFSRAINPEEDDNTSDFEFSLGTKF